MLRRLLSFLALLALLLGAAGCAPSRSVPAKAGAAPTGNANGPFGSLLAHSRDVGPTAADRPITLLLLLQDPSAPRRAADLAALYNPRSPDFGRFQTPADLALDYGPSPASVAQLQARLQRDGLMASWLPGTARVDVTGPASRIDAIFATNVHDYVAPSGQQFYASGRDPRVPADLRPLVTAASRVNSYLPDVLKARPPAMVQAVPHGGLTPDGIALAYDMKPLRDQGLDGSGETVVLMEFDAFKQSDLDRFTQQFHLPPLHPTVVGKAILPAEGEATMDLEVVHAIAPGAKIVIYNHPKVSNAQKPAYHTQVLRANPGAIMSLSIGYGCDLAVGQTLENGLRQAYDEADQLGISVFVASGDSGAFSCLENASTWGVPPSTDYVSADAIAAVPGVTAVGGTRVSVDVNGGWYDETVWEDPARTVGGGGDISAFFDAPSWQQGPGVQNSYNTNNHRQVPDVSADADSESGMAIILDGQQAQGGGTSEAAPIWAGMTALINQYLKKQGLHGVGFVNPALYALAAGHPQYPPFHDINAGSNLVYPATPGYDLATGLGSPDAWNLARDLAAYQQGGGT